jgi:hypothetical protein
LVQVSRVGGGDESLEDLANLPAPEVIAREIVEDLTAALAEFEAVAVALEAASGGECPGRLRRRPSQGEELALTRAYWAPGSGQRELELHRCYPEV